MTDEADEIDRATMRASAGPRLALLVESFALLAGRGLVDAPPNEFERKMWEAPRAIVAHGTEARPLFFYGTRAALALFEMRAAGFIGLPSDRSAEPGAREARAN